MLYLIQFLGQLPFVSCLYSQITYLSPCGCLPPPAPPPLSLLTEKTLSSSDLDVRTKALGCIIYAIRSLLPGLTVNLSERVDMISARVAKLNSFPEKAVKLN